MTKRIVERWSDLDETTRALLIVGLSALLYSLVPISIDVSGSSGAPLTVGAGVLIGHVLATHIGRYSHRQFRPIRYRQIVRRCFDEHVAVGSTLLSLVMLGLGGLGYVFFVWSTRYIDTAVSSSLFELWPMTWILAFHYIDRARRRTTEYSIVPLSSVVLMLLQTGAIALVVFSTTSSAGSGNGVSFPALGIALGIASPVFAAFTAFSFQAADRLLYGKSRGPQDDWNLLKNADSDRKRVEESIVHGSVVLSRGCVSPIVLIVATVDTGFPAAIFSRSFVGGILVGLVLSGPAGFLVRRANMISSRREIIALQYLSPILALGWLAWGTDIDVTRMDFLILGTVSIVALNMLINADPEKKRSREVADDRTSDERSSATIQERYSLKGLVVSLLLFGMVIYFRDELMTGQDMSWSENGSYWGVLGLASTVFALLLAFRLTRVEALLLAEDYRTLGMVRRIELLPDEVFGDDDKGESRNSLLKFVGELNRASRLKEYRGAYNDANRTLQEIANRIRNMETGIANEQRIEIGHLRTELDALAHGRQQAREFAERVALWLIGATIIAFCLAVPSESSGWSRLLSETFVVVLSAIVVYLLFHLADMRRSRADELITDKSPDWGEDLPEGRYVRFRDERGTRWQRIFAGVTVLGAVSTVVALLAWSRLISG